LISQDIDLVDGSHYLMKIKGFNMMIRIKALSVQNIISNGLGTKDA
jgi:hypothetical protein